MQATVRRIAPFRRAAVAPATRLMSTARADVPTDAGHAAQAWPHHKINKPVGVHLFSESHAEYKGEWKGFDSERKSAHRELLDLDPKKLGPSVWPSSKFSTPDGSASSDRLAARLENRANDKNYRSLMTSYFPQLASCEHVVELGCGTGAVLRALLHDPSFKGRVTGLDQSGAFLKVAEQAAAAEGLDKSRYFFEASNAQAAPKGRCGDMTASADAIICHTLLAHVSDPAAVLASARKLAKPGAKLVVMDGDYGSLTYSHAADPVLGRRMDQAITRAIYRSPLVIRRLPALLEQTGWKLESASGQCLSEVGAGAEYWSGYAEAYLPAIKSSGLVSPQEINAWWDAQQQSIRDGHFFAAATYYTMTATAS